MGPELRERTKQFALKIMTLYSALPHHQLASVLGKQLLRSGTSIGANYREAFRARSKAEYVAKLGLCLQELDETSYWLELLQEGQIVAHEQLAPFFDEINQLIAILTTLAKKNRPA